MRIKFKEDRKLLNGKIVKAEKGYDFPKAEAQAFIDNGFAKKAKVKQGDK